MLTFSLNPKETRIFLPHTESLPFEKPGAGIDLTFIARFILIPGAVRCSKPLANLFRCVNRKLLSIYIEECNSKAPSVSSIICFIRPMSTANTLEKGIKKGKKCTHVYLNFLHLNVCFLHLDVCINKESTIKAVL